MIHLRKGKKTLCGREWRQGEKWTSNPNHVDCARCLRSIEVRARKKVEKKSKHDLKALEDECKALWRHSVWLIWGGKCALCGKVPPNDHNSHHYFTQGAHAALRFEPYCGCLLCYGCHMGKIHGAGEIEQIREIYLKKIGTVLFDQMKLQAHDIAKYPYETLLNVKAYLEGFNDTWEKKE